MAPGAALLQTSVSMWRISCFFLLLEVFETKAASVFDQSRSHSEDPQHRQLKQRAKEVRMGRGGVHVRKAGGSGMSTVRWRQTQKEGSFTAAAAHGSAVPTSFPTSGKQTNGVERPGSSEGQTPAVA